MAKTTIDYDAVYELSIAIMYKIANAKKKRYVYDSVHIRQDIIEALKKQGIEVGEEKQVKEKRNG